MSKSQVSIVKTGTRPDYEAVLAAVKPSLTVVDGIICQEGMAPIYGDPVEMDLILASRDLV
ncbi:MAG: DUF362 domain-containing protein, partial [Desulfobacterales bacterium]